MIKIILVSFLFAFLGCSNSSTSGSPIGGCENCNKARTIDVDYSKSEIKVSVFGQEMGTPDGAIIDSYLRGTLVNGLIDRLEVLATDTEGGATYCVLINDTGRRKIVLDDLQRIQTDQTQTFYSIVSQTTSCMP